MRTVVLFVFLIITGRPSFSQEHRLSDHNTIGWLVYTGTFQIQPKIALHTEYQWRRVDGFKNWQQGLVRLGINYAVTKDVSLNAGYAFAETFTYGDYPASFDFPEHRIYEQVVIKNPVGSMDLSHRLTLEQRFVGKVEMQNGVKNTGYNFLNRLRYRFRSEFPLDKNIATRNSLSVILQDEVFIGWGRNVEANVFDQNRLAILLGYRLNPKVKFEAGYLNQILQQGKKINDKPVFQYNNGFMLSTNISISKK